MQRFLADENVIQPAVFAARAAGIDLEWIAEFESGVGDDELLEIAVDRNRVLVTLLPAVPMSRLLDHLAMSTWTQGGKTVEKMPIGASKQWHALTL